MTENKTRRCSFYSGVRPARTVLPRNICPEEGTPNYHCSEPCHTGASGHYEPVPDEMLFICPIHEGPLLEILASDGQLRLLCQPCSEPKYYVVGRSE